MELKKKIFKEKLYFPKKINLLGESYKIKLTECKCKKCDSESAGTISYKEGIIELHKHLNKIEAEYVLFHELAHFFANYYSAMRQACAIAVHGFYGNSGD